MAISLKSLLLEGNLVRLCAVCDKLAPTQVGPTEVKSHGICKEHYIAYRVESLDQDIELVRAQAEAKAKENPDFFSKNTSGAKDTDKLPI